MTNLLQDIRYALRQLRNAPGFTLTAILTLALGVGANTAVFTLVHAVMLKSLPVADPGQLYRVGDNDNCCVWGGFQDDWGLFAGPLYEYLRDHTSGFKDMAAMQSWGWVRVSIRRQSSSNAAESSSAEWVSGNYFHTLGVQTLLGRPIAPSDDTESAPPVAVVSYRAWQRRFASDASIVGSNIDINGHPFTIVGVAPPGFFGDRIATDPAEFWLPLSTEILLRGDRSLLKEANSNWLYIIGRISPDANPKSIEAQLNIELHQWLSSVPHLTGDQPSRINKQKIRLGPGGGGIANLKEYFKQGLYLLIAASGLVLLIACANLANLLLARAAARRQQIAIRTALGASRTRLVRGTLTESLLLAVIGGAFGLLIAFAGARAMLLIVFHGAHFVTISAAPSLPILGFTLGVSLLTGVLFGVIPAWMASRSDPVEALRGAGRSTRDHSALPQRSLIVLQAALSLVLLATAGLVTQSLRNLQNQDFRFQTDDRYFVEFDPELAGYTTDRLPALYDELQRRLPQLPGVIQAGFAMYFPQGQDNWNTGVFIQAHPVELGKEPGAGWTRISPGYFETIGTAILRGRSITEQDTASSRRVAVVNQAFVKKNFPNGEDPIGQHFGKDEPEHAGDYEIVGVVADAKFQDPASPVRPMFFLPFTQPVAYKDSDDQNGEQRSLYAHQIVLHVIGRPEGLEQQVRSMLASLDPNLALLEFRSYHEQVSGNLNQERLLSDLTGLFSLLALLLASVGLYGVTSYRVARRTGEIGIRMALGATPWRVVAMVLRSAFSHVLLGLGVGIPLAIGAAKLMANKLFGVGTHDVRVLGVAALALAFAALIATVAPARSAAEIQPMQALRTE
jgi:predicted permease